jgi:hypothetical protein
MYTKIINGREICIYGPNLYEDDILSHINFLNEQIQKHRCDDWTLLFSDPIIIEEWIALVSAMEKMEKWEEAKDDVDMEEDVRPYTVYALTLYKLCYSYDNLYLYFDCFLSNLTYHSAEWPKRESFSADAMEILSNSPYSQILGNLGDIKNHLEEVNSKLHQVLPDIHSTFADIFNVLKIVMNRGRHIAQKRCPFREDVVKAIDNDLKQYMFLSANNLLQEMKRDLDRHYKTSLTDPYTFKLWGEMLSVDEDALKMALEGRFSNCFEEKQEHWDEDVRHLMDENSELIRRIWWLCYTDKLIDWRTIGDQGDIVKLLDANNLDMFFEIIVRRNLIQCEMYPELKKQLDEWLRGDKEQQLVYPIPAQCKYKLAPNNDRHLAKIIQAMYDERLFLKEDDTPATSVEDVAHYLGPMLGVDFKYWRRTLNAGIDSPSCLEVFEKLRRNIEKRKSKNFISIL